MANVRYFIRKFKNDDVEIENGTLIFTTDDWDDSFKFSTLFHVSYRTGAGSNLYIGDVKIFSPKSNVIDQNYFRTIDDESLTINDYFERLPDHFYSLGQDERYYQNIKKYCKKDYLTILSDLQDVAINRTKREYLKDNYWDAYIYSLRRESTVSNAMKHVDEEYVSYFSFEFTNRMNNFEQKCQFNFEQNDKIPWRINAVIGKNGVGKTIYLSNLARYLSSKNSNESGCYKISPLDDHLKESLSENDFIEYIGFNNFITVSFNMFDSFYQPGYEHNKAFQSFNWHSNIMYKKLDYSRSEIINDYNSLIHNDLKLNRITLEEADIKIKTLNGRLDNLSSSLLELITNLPKTSNNNDLRRSEESYTTISMKTFGCLKEPFMIYSDMINSIKHIKESSGYNSRVKLELLEELFKLVIFPENEDLAHAYYQELLEVAEAKNDKISHQLLQKLQEKMGSGQNLLLYVYLQIIAKINNNSLILIDEPEVNLHPNAVASYMKFMYLILDKYKSYAILNTHSPQIIQEIPRKNVNVFRNIGGNFSVVKLERETFGSNISDIVYDVFKVTNNESPYMSTFEYLANEGIGFEEFLRLFDTPLSMNAQLKYQHEIMKLEESDV